MTTSKEHNSIISKITSGLVKQSHKPMVLKRKSIRPTTSLKKNLFKVKSLRIGSAQKQFNIQEENVTFDN
jgi:hypothetical protein